MSRRQIAGIGTLGYAVLGLIADEPLNGYDLTRAFDLSLSNAWSAGHSQIYPELARLEQLGFIEVVKIGTRRSKIFAATVAGREALRAWLHSDVQQGPRNETILRLFFVWTLDNNEAKAYMQREKAMHQLRLERYRAIIAMFPENPDRATAWSRITLEIGIRQEQAMLGWVEYAEAKLAERDFPK